jgi:nitrite reductase/ring-hydroxylating ferredoxin subunit
MDRKEFLKTCGFACLGITGLGAVLQGCHPSKILSGRIEGSDLVIPVADFDMPDEKQPLSKKYKKYVVIQNDALQFPICLFRLSPTEYSALLMKCPHQGAELQVFGEKLQCPAHGSEFDQKGIVQSAPADVNLRSFPVLIDNLHLKISLK